MLETVSRDHVKVYIRDCEDKSEEAEEVPPLDEVCDKIPDVQIAEDE